MKIVHVIDYFQPSLGYQEYFFAKTQKEQGHDVTVVTSDRYFPFDNYQEIYVKVLGHRILKPGKFKEKGITVYRLPVIYEYKTFIWLNNLHKTLSFLKPDLVFMHNMFTPTALFVALNKRKIGYKLIYDTHTAAFNSNFESSIFRRIYYKIFIKIILKPFIIKSADKVFAIGESEQNFICQTYDFTKKDIPVIPLGVDIKEFCPDKQGRKIMRSKLSFKDSDCVIIFTGKIQPEKDIDVLIKLIAKLKEDGIKTKLLLIGNANVGLKEELTNLMEKLEVKDLVLWIEMVPHDELPKYYQTADLAIWPGNPSIAIFEAMACGLPTILSNSNISSANVAVSRGGAVSFKRGNLVELTEKVKQLLIKKQYQITSMKSLEIIRKDYSWEVISKKAMMI